MISAETSEIESSIFVEAHLEKLGAIGDKKLCGTVSSTLIIYDELNKLHMFERVYN